MIFQRSFIDAIIDSLAQGWGGKFVFTLTVIACLLIFKLRFPIPKKILLDAIISAIAIPFVIPYAVTQILILIALILIIGSEMIFFTGMSKRLSNFREPILDITQIIGLVILLWASLSLVIGTANFTVALASGANHISTRLINKIDEPEKDRVLLMFSVSQDVSRSGFMDVWLPIANSESFTEENCYRVEYFKSPFLRVEGRSDAYVTSIQSQACDSSVE